MGLVLEGGGDSVQNDGAEVVKPGAPLPQPPPHPRFPCCSNPGDHMVLRPQLLDGARLPNLPGESSGKGNKLLVC